MKYLFFILLFTTYLHAEEEYKMRPDYWSPGLHLLAGGGVNAVSFYSDRRNNEIGYGLNFKTDLGYYFTNRFAIEGSSNVKFNRVGSYFIWDTLLTGGIRYRIKDHYFRLFYGRAPTVIFFGDNKPDEFKGTKASRLHYDGPVYGFGIGRMYKNKKGVLWFMEGSATLQRLDKREAIYMDGWTPKVVASERDRAYISSLFFMIGVMIF